MVGIDFGTTKTIATMRIVTKEKEIEEVDLDSEILRLCPSIKEGVIYHSYAMPSKLRVIIKEDTYELRFGEDTWGISGLRLESIKRCLFCELAYGTSYSKIREDQCWNKKNYRACFKEFAWCREGERRFEIKEYVLSPRTLYRAFMEELFKRIKSELDSRLSGEEWLLTELKITFPVLLYRVGPKLGGFVRTELGSIAREIFGKKERKGVQIEVVEEPTAALLAQWQIVKNIPPGYGMIIDVGGGTTDLLVYMKLDNTVRIIGKDSFAKGGDEYDYIAKEPLLDKLKAKNINETQLISKDDEITERAAQLKEEKNLPTWDGKIDFPNNNWTLHFEKTERENLERNFQQVSTSIVERIRVFLETLDLSIVRKITHVFLTGGASNIKTLKQGIKNLFPEAKTGDIQTITPSLPHFNNDSKLVAPGIGASLPIQIYRDIIQHKLPVDLILLVQNQDIPRQRQEWRIYHADKQAEDIQRAERIIKWDRIKVHLQTEDTRKFERHLLNSVGISVKKHKTRQKLSVEYTIDYNGKTKIKIGFGGKTKLIFDGYPTKTGKFF